MALIEAPLAAAGGQVELVVRERPVAARLVAIPFYRRPR
jgi:hypothetical protein